MPKHNSMFAGDESGCLDVASGGEDDVWLVNPIPGYVVKFREVNSECQTLMVKEKWKLFLNVCHCIQLPPPMDDLSEDEVANLLDSEDFSKYRIPLSIGDVEIVLDRKGQDSVKIDVIVNSTFYLKRLEQSEFFRRFFLLVAMEAIEKKHDIKLGLKGSVKLKNRKCVGDLSVQRIRKKPREIFIRETNSAHQPEEKLIEQRSIPKNCLVILKNGKQLEVNVKLGNLKQPVMDVGRLSVRMNDDHLLIILDRKETIVDIYFPVKVDYEKAEGKLMADERVLQILVPVVW